MKKLFGNSSGPHTTRTRLTVGFFMVLSVFMVLGSLLPILEPKVSADVGSLDQIKNGKFTAVSPWEIDGDFGAGGTVQFGDDNSNDTHPNYKPKTGNFCDPGTIKSVNGIPGNLKYGINANKNADRTDATFEAQVKLGFIRGSGDNCVGVLFSTTVQNPNQAANTSLTWSGTHIVTKANAKDNDDFSLANGTAKFYVKSESKDCAGGKAILLNSVHGNDGTGYFLNKTVGSSLPSELKSIVDSDCKVASKSSVHIAGKYNGGSGGGGGGTATGPASSEEQKLTCETSGFDISWLVCAAVKAMVATIGKVDTLISSELTIDSSKIFCDTGDTCQAYYAAWESFRNIALSFIVVAGLIIVISQALGMELLDAYTVKKTLPRVLIAAVGITLSWPLMQLAINISNDLGFGVRYLIYHPFTKLGDGLDLSFGQGLEAYFFGFSALALFSMMGLLAYAATAALAVGVAVLVLILRQIAITMLIILAPVAIVAYVLPNTQRFYKFWWESFSKALLMFPLIAGFIAAGHVFSAIALKNGGGDVGVGAANQLIGFGAYFAPYFLLPATFQLAGGALRQIGGFVNDRSRGGFDGLRNYRKGRREEMMKRNRAGNRWNKDFGRFGSKDWMSVGHLASRAAVNIFDQDELLPYRIGKDRETVLGSRRLGRGATAVGKAISGRSSAKIGSEIDHSIVEQSTKGLQHLEQAQMAREGYKGLAAQYGEFKGSLARDYKGYAAGTAISDVLDGELKGRPATSLGDIETLGGIMSLSDQSKEAEGGHDILENKGYLANLNRDGDMAYADVQAIGLMGMAVTGYDGSGQAFAKTGNQLMSRLGPSAGSHVFGNAQRLGKQSRPDQRDRYGFSVVTDDHGHMQYAATYATDPFGDAATGSAITLKGLDWNGAKGESVKEMAQTYEGLATGSASEYWDIQAGQYEAQAQAATTRDDRDRFAAQATKARETSEKLLEQRDNIRRVIAYGAANTYGDAGAQLEWQKIAQNAGLNQSELEAAVAEVERQNAAENAARTGGGGGGQPPLGQPPNLGPPQIGG